MLKLLLISLLLVLWTSCTPKSVKRLLRDTPSHLPFKVVIKDVPFVPQTTNYCGPATLAMVLNYRGIPVSIDELGRNVYLPDAGGSLQAEMTAQLREQGLLAYQLPNTLEALLSELAAGNPVIVLQNQGLKVFPQWHYALAIGYDLPKRHLILHSGNNESHRLSLRTLAYTWRRSKNWALVPLNVGMLPFQNDASGVFIASAELETHLQENSDIETLYETALNRWPDHIGLNVALANHYLKTGQTAAAVRTLAFTVDQHPSSALTYNNFAYALIAADCGVAAEKAIRCATNLDSAPIYRQSLDEINKLSGTLGNAPNCPAIQCPVTN